MRSAPVRTRSFVIVMVAWMALSLAPVVALAPSAAAAFATVAAGLAVAATLRLSLRWGVGVAVVSIVLFALAQAEGPASPWTLGPDALERLGRSLIMGETLVPDLLAAVALLGAAATAELASAGLEWDTVFRRAMWQRPERNDEPARGELPASGTPPSDPLAPEPPASSQPEPLPPEPEALEPPVSEPSAPEPPASRRPEPQPADPQTWEPPASDPLTPKPSPAGARAVEPAHSAAGGPAATVVDGHAGTASRRRRAQEESKHSS